jgi:hypothetical protein
MQPAGALQGTDLQRPKSTGYGLETAIAGPPMNREDWLAAHNRSAMALALTAAGASVDLFYLRP